MYVNRTLSLTNKPIATISYAYSHLDTQSVTVSESETVEFDVASGVTLKPGICQWYPTL